MSARIDIPSLIYRGISVDEEVLVGVGADEQIPTIVPTVPYLLTFSADILSTATWKFRGTTGTTFGHSFGPNQILIWAMAGGKALFVSHDHATVAQKINVTRIPIS